MSSLPRYDYKGWIIKREPTSFAEPYLWTALVLDEDGYVDHSAGFNSKRACEIFIDEMEEDQ